MPMLQRRVGRLGAQHRNKEQTAWHNSRTGQFSPSARFWDNLSHIPLVKRALRELDRRNDTYQLQRQQGSGASISPGHPRQLEARFKYQDIKRFSPTGGPDLSNLRGYANVPTESPPSEVRGRHRHRSTTMPRRGSSHRGHLSTPGRGKRRLDVISESIESEDEPRAARDNLTRTKSATTTATSTRTTPHDRAFAQHLLDYNILSLVHRSSSGAKPKPPDNLLEIKAKLDSARPQDPPEDFERFSSDHERSSNEDDAVTLLDKLQGDDAALSHIIRRKTMMSNLAPLTDGEIPPGNPDRAYGAAAAELHRDVRWRLGDMVVPTRDGDFVCPNFVVHARSDSGSTKVARGQAAYEGALAARGMQALWDFGDRRGGGDGNNRRAQEDPGAAQAQAQAARVARTITCTWASGVLKMYATHREPDPGVVGGPPPDEPAQHEFPTYVSSLIGSWIMTDEEDQFHRGLAAYRNGLDWAKRQRDDVISRANARVEADNARRRRDEQAGLGKEHVAGAQEHCELGRNFAEADGCSREPSASGASEIREQDEEYEDEDDEDEDKEGFRSMNSQRTVTTWSMSQRLTRGIDSR